MYYIQICSQLNMLFMFHSISLRAMVNCSNEHSFCTNSAHSGINNTLHGQKLLASALNVWIQVYKIQHLATQSAFKKTCERMGASEELPGLSVVIGWHSCDKVHSWNLFPPRYSTISFEWYYCTVEAFRDLSNSTQSGRLLTDAEDVTECWGVSCS